MPQVLSQSTNHDPLRTMLSPADRHEALRNVSRDWLRKQYSFEPTRSNTIRQQLSPSVGKILIYANTNDCGVIERSIINYHTSKHSLIDVEDVIRSAACGVRTNHDPVLILY